MSRKPHPGLAVGRTGSATAALGVPLSPSQPGRLWEGWRVVAESKAGVGRAAECGGLWPRPGAEGPG